MLQLAGELGLSGGEKWSLSVPLRGEQAAGECLRAQLAHPGY